MLKKSASSVLASFSPQRTQRVRLGPSLAAALLDGIFEHPVRAFFYCATRPDHRSSRSLIGLGHPEAKT